MHQPFTHYQKSRIRRSDSLETADLDLGFVEIRNVLPGKAVCDDLGPEEVTHLCTRLGVWIAGINALQKFNLVDNLQQSTEELKTLVGLAKAIACPAVVLCPNNDREDSRSEDQRFEEKVRCLQALAPIFCSIHFAFDFSSRRCLHWDSTDRCP